MIEIRCMIMYTFFCSWTGPKKRGETNSTRGAQEKNALDYIIHIRDPWGQKNKIIVERI